jgi:hypothetical protein
MLFRIEKKRVNKGGNMFRCSQVIKLAVAVGSLLLAGNAAADQFHYNNFIMGDRAVGLGGAYSAVSDDASGVVYNPAGLAFALSNDISGSANAFYSREITYKETLGDEDFVEHSNGSLPAFFGVLQKLDHHVPGLVMAFGSYTTDSDLKDQDTLIEDITVGSSNVRRFHRTSNIRASTQYSSLAAGYRLTSNIAIGFGLTYFAVDELTQEYQDGKQTVSNIENIEWQILTQNIRQRLTVFGIEPHLGIQVALGGKFSLGASYKQGIIASENMEIAVETRKQYLANDEAIASIESGSSAGAAVTENVSNELVEAPLGSWPGQFRFGAAWFASTRFLWTADVVYYTEAKGGDDIAAFGNKQLFERESIMNYSTGVEYYVLPSFPLRFGLFTNNDARPVIDHDKTAQADHIDYMGETLFIAWVQPNSQIAVGAILQQGSGEAQKLGDKTVQKVEAESVTYAFSATHNF